MNRRYNAKRYHVNIVNRQYRNRTNELGTIECQAHIGKGRPLTPVPLTPGNNLSMMPITRSRDGNFPLFYSGNKFGGARFANGGGGSYRART